ncbi:MAG: hypothetical protein J6Y02_19060 [Pseudobutyrivibrio sp.]|nr:hypothetical protein [Pseudobutyrivibrio sp.]
MSQYGYLVHHGIKGQKWGVRNGPPYPLGSGTKRIMRKLRNLTGSGRRNESQGDASEEGINTGSAALDKAYDKIASMDEEDWGRVKKHLTRATLAAGAVAGITAVTSILASAGAVSIYAANDPQAKALVEQAVKSLGKIALSSEALNEIASNLSRSGMKKAGDIVKDVAVEKAKDIASKLTPDAINSSMPNSEILATVRKFKRSASRDDLIAWLNNPGIVEAVSKDARAIDLLSDELRFVKTADNKQALGVANAGIKAVQNARNNRSSTSRHTRNMAILGTATATVNAVTGAVTAAENLYRKKDSPLIKAGKQFVTDYFLDKKEEKKNG